MLGVPQYGTSFLYRVSLVQNQVGPLFVQHLPSMQRLGLSMRYGGPIPPNHVPPPPPKERLVLPPAQAVSAEGQSLRTSHST